MSALRRGCIRAAVAALTVQGAALADASAATPFISMHTEVLSEPEPIAASWERWGSEFDSGERQWLVADMAVGLIYRGLRVALEQRALLDLRINSEAAEFYGRIDRREELTPGDSVPVHLDIEGFTGQGARVGYAFDGTGWSLNVSASLFQASHLMSGSVDGMFEATAEQDFSFNAAVNYHYYRDPIFHRPNVKKPSGTGWALRLYGEWQLTDHWYIDALADDLFAQIRWKDAPFTDAQAHTDRKRYDAEGFAIFDPLLSGREGYTARYDQELEPRLRGNISYQRGPWSARFAARRQFDYNLMGAGGGYTFDNDLQFNALVWPQLDALDLELEYGRLSVGLSVDDVEWHEMRFINVHLAYGY